MAGKARKRLIAWLAVLAGLCLVTSLVLVLFLWGRPERSSLPEPVESTSATLTAGPTESGTDSAGAADSGGFTGTEPPFDSGTPPSETSGGETAPPETASGETTSATDIALAGAAIASAFGGLCTGIAAVMVARRTPRQGPGP